MSSGPGDIIGLHDGRIMETHGPDQCSGDFCCVHNPSDHPLNKAPLNWRGDRRLMERICEHGVGHPDPDDIEHQRRKFGDDIARTEGVHGCCGCCTRPTDAAVSDAQA